jgi:branched-chain amino acid transport system permease protein
MIVQDALAKDDPVFWLFWIGLILIAIVLFAPGGLIGLIEKAAQFCRAKLGRRGREQAPGEIECRAGR